MDLIATASLTASACLVVAFVLAFKRRYIPAGVATIIAAIIFAGVAGTSMHTLNTRTALIAAIAMFICIALTHMALYRAFTDPKAHS